MVMKMLNKKILGLIFILSSFGIMRSDDLDQAVALDELNASQYASVLDTGAIGITDSKLNRLAAQINKKQKKVESQISKKPKPINTPNSRENVGEGIIKALN